MWFDVEAMDLGFTTRSPFVLENQAVINATPARVFEIFATAERQVEWFQDFVGCRWTTPAQRGVGAEREIALKLLTVKERFLAWDEGKRLTFTVYGITLPFVSAMVEDMLFEPIGEGQTRFIWRAHYRPTLVARPVHKIMRAVFGKMFAASTRGVAEYATLHAKGP